MTKKHFIALAKAIKEHNAINPNAQFGRGHLESLAYFCQWQNPNFNRALWLNYIAGSCGPNGKNIKTS